MAKHTIETLTSDLDNFKRSVNRRFKGISDNVNEITPKVAEMHDFIVEQRGFERGQAGGKKDSNISISKDVWGIIKWLILVILALVGIKATMP